MAGVEFIDLTSGEKIGFNSAAMMPTASVIKVPVLIELYRQAESKPGLLNEDERSRPEHRLAAAGC